MSGDGVSLPTSIAQLGNVAKTQAKGQQSQNTAAPFSEQLEKRDEIKVQRVQQTDKSEQDGVDPEARREREDKRKKRRRQRKERRLLAKMKADDGNDQAAENQEEEIDSAAVGIMIDRRA